LAFAAHYPDEVAGRSKPLIVVTAGYDAEWMAAQAKPAIWSTSHVGSELSPLN